MAATDLFDVAHELLEACAAAVATTPAGAIDRAFVSPSLPAFDCCPQLTVHVGNALEGDSLPLSPPMQPSHRVVDKLVPMVQLTCSVIRCTPGPDMRGDPPEVVEIEDAAKQTNADLWAIWNGLRTAKREETLFPPREREFFFDPAFPISIQGGCAGWLIPFRVTLGGYKVG